MKLEELQREIQNLAARTKGINTWIKQNPHITDPNAYEITDCNVTLAEILGTFQTIATKEVSANTLSSYPEIIDCYNQITEMDQLRDTKNHPFFQSEEAKKLYEAVKQSQSMMNYEVPENMETRRIKKELLCKSMSVPFYIWQVHRTEPEYEYDNINEFNGMKDMLDIYKQEGNTQFVPEIEGLFQVIEKNYKYSETKTHTKR